MKVLVSHDMFLEVSMLLRYILSNRERKEAES